ncbi:MAG: DUF975 family protein [Oscillospiraceae bacterium]|nr:DUF975 family protein [Oscillospiraceae bacterium]
MELFRIIKSDARRAMRFCGGRTVASVIIVALAFLAISLTESVLLTVFCGSEVFASDILSLAGTFPEAVFIISCSAVVWIFVIPALLLGFAKLHFSFAEGKDESIQTLFDSFSSFKKFIGSAIFAVVFIIRYAFVFLLAILPGGAFFWFFETYIPEGNRTVEILKISAFFIAAAVIVLCVFLAFIFIQRWSLAPYYRVLGNGIQKSFSLSAKASKGLCTNIISFKFSFIGWALLSFFVLPLLWTVPYYSLANAIHAKYLMEKYERSLAEVPETVDSEVTFQETD